MHGSGEAEVENGHSPVVAQEEIGGLDVAMGDPRLVGSGQPMSDVGPDVRSPLDGDRNGARELLGEGVPRQELHDGIVDSLVATQFVDRDDVRVRQCRDGASLPLEPVPRFLAGDLALENHLDRHVSSEPRIACAIDLAHSASPQPFEDLVLPKLLTREGARLGRLSQGALDRSPERRQWVVRALGFAMGDQPPSRLE